jgi:hypothetical protein
MLLLGDAPRTIAQWKPLPPLAPEANPNMRTKSSTHGWLAPSMLMRGRTNPGRRAGELRAALNTAEARATAMDRADQERRRLDLVARLRATWQGT